MQLLVLTLLATLFPASQALKCHVCKGLDACEKNPNPTDCVDTGYCTYLKGDRTEIRTCAPKPEILYGPQNNKFTKVSDYCTKITVEKVDYLMKICNKDNCNADCCNADLECSDD